MNWALVVVLSLVSMTIAGFAADANLESRRQQLRAALDDE